MVPTDLVNSLQPLPGFAPVVVTDDTAQVSAIIDMQGLNGLMFVIATGTLADAGATFTTLIEEGDDSGLSDAAAVGDSDLLGTEALASFTETSDGKTFKIGYIGNKRYVRLTLTPSGNLSAAPLCAIAITAPNVLPTVNPPA